MSIDILQNKLRKMKDPAALWLCPSVDLILPALLEEGESPAASCGAYRIALLEGLADQFSAGRVSFDAFGLLGHGALVCAGSLVLGAWQEREDGDYLAAAKDAAERLKRNLTRYVTIL